LEKVQKPQPSVEAQRPQPEPKPKPEPAPKPEEPKKEKKADSPPLDIASLLPLLTGGGNQADMLSSLLASQKKDSKGGFDIASLLPLLMNGGLGNMFGGGGAKKEVTPQSINLSDYKRIG